MTNTHVLPSSGFHCSICGHIKADQCNLECSCCCSLDEEVFWEEDKQW